MNLPSPAITCTISVGRYKVGRYLSNERLQKQVAKQMTSNFLASPKSFPKKQNVSSFLIVIFVDFILIDT